jgi:hypothetical protein
MNVCRRRPSAYLITVLPKPNNTKRIRRPHGSYVESKEHTAGFYTINEDDLDATLTGARTDLEPANP